MEVIAPTGENTICDDLERWPGDTVVDCRWPFKYN